MKIAVLLLVVTSALLLEVQSQIMATAPQSIECYCDEGSEGCNQGTCTTDIQCRVDVDLGTMELSWSCQQTRFTQCMDDSDETLKSLCCTSGDSCNRCLVPPSLTYEDCIVLNLADVYPQDCNFSCSSLGRTVTETEGEAATFPEYIAAVSVLAGLAVVLVVLMFAVFFCVYRVHKRAYHINPLGAGSVPDSESFDPSRRGIESSGGLSGGGAISLEKRHYFDDLIMECKIGSGAMGDVWKASRFGVVLALKRSLSTQTSQSDIKREKDIFTSSRLVHPNVVMYFFSDRYIGKGSIIIEEFWITMKYYKHGSLFNYLRSNSLTSANVINILKDISSALVYLHTPVYNGHGALEQGGIAHRDLKTPNILVESLDGHCVVSDFGLAVMAEDFTPPKRHIKVLVGTKRYMAPEVLSQSVDASLESFMQTDLYSFGLIMWEVLNRAENKAGEANEYQQPYYEHLGRCPSIEEVRSVVVESGLRPSVENFNEPYYRSLSNLMKECWSDTPDCRPKAIRILKKIDSISI